MDRDNGDIATSLSPPTTNLHEQFWAFAFIVTRGESLSDNFTKSYPSKWLVYWTFMHLNLVAGKSQSEAKAKSRPRLPSRKNYLSKFVGRTYCKVTKMSSSSRSRDSDTPTIKPRKYCTGEEPGRSLMCHQVPDRLVSQYLCFLSSSSRLPRNFYATDYVRNIRKIQRIIRYQGTSVVKLTHITMRGQQTLSAGDFYIRKPYVRFT